MENKRDPLFTKIAPSYVSDVFIGNSDLPITPNKEKQFHLHSFYKYLPDYPNMTLSEKLTCSLALQYFYSVCIQNLQRGLVESFFADQVNAPWENRPTLYSWNRCFVPGIFKTGKAT